MRLPLNIALAALIGTVLGLPAAAHAVYPGGNGKIAFVRDGQIWTINPNRTGETQLTSDASPSSYPEWSPDGRRIAYTRGSLAGRTIRVMNADGTGDHHVYGPYSGGTISPTWSPDGRRLAFAVPETVAPPCCLTVQSTWRVDADGSNPTRLHYYPAESARLSDLEWSPRGDEIGYTIDHTDVGETDAALLDLKPPGGLQFLTIDPDEVTAAPAWSPDAGRLALLSDLGVVDYEVWTMKRDGNEREQITNTGAKQLGVEWSPDGSKLVLSSGEVGCSGTCDAGLYLMNPDGSGIETLINTASSETSPDWQPVVGPPPAGYPRPRGATPMTVPLVPAYVPCAAPNRAHGAPLSFGSCAPPAQASARLTVGTPDANGAPVRMIASVRIRAIVGNSATESNEADLKIVFSATDIRCYEGDTRSVCTSGNTQAGRDYAGGVRLRTDLRLTDRYNLPAPGGNQPGTMSDSPIEVDVNGCTPTPSDASVGSTCSLATTIGARLGVTEDRRAVMELGQVEVLDGGATGTVDSRYPSSGMSTFLRQGVFIP